MQLLENGMSEFARIKHPDPVTGATIIQWTHENQKSQHLYFTFTQRQSGRPVAGLDF
jgi:hypothetical protein